MPFRRRSIECPECSYRNPRVAPRCLSCGAVIGAMGPLTVPGVHHSAQAEPAAAAASGPVAEALADFEIDLHLPDDAEIGPVAPVATTDPAAPTECFVVDTELPLHVAEPAPMAPAMSADAEELIGTDERPLNRATRRALTRRAVHAGNRRLRPPPSPQGQPPTVLVVDADATTRSRLTVWLERFGFRVHAEGNLDQGRAMIAARCFATGFVGAPLAGEAGQAALALLEAARDLGTESPCRMVYIDDGRSATDRVRARFAGFDAVLDAPISRGSVARTIESLGYALPRDERRA